MPYARPLWLRAPTTKPLSATACVSFSRCFSVRPWSGPVHWTLRLARTPNGRIGVGLPPGQGCAPADSWRLPRSYPSRSAERRIRRNWRYHDDGHATFHVHGDAHEEVDVGGNILGPNPTANSGL